MKNEYTVDVKYDERTHTYVVQCPQCPTTIRALTNNGAGNLLCDHLNTDHLGPRDC